MSDIEIRPAREDELPEVNDIALLAQGFADVVASRSPGHVSPVVRHGFDSGTLRVALDGTGALVGFGSSLRRDGSLVLAQLFVLPERQSAGAGRELLKTVMPAGPELRATVASNDPRAVALYMRSGMLPRWPHFDLEGDAAALGPLSDTGITIVEGSGYDDEMVTWDTEISGRERPEEHRYLLERLDATPLWFERGGKRVGYGYAGRRADFIHLGPIGCRDEADARDCVLAAVGWASKRAGEIGIELSGLHPALKPLVDARMRISEPQVFMASSDPDRFGDPRRYAPTGAPFL